MSDTIEDKIKAKLNEIFYSSDSDCIDNEYLSAEEDAKYILSLFKEALGEMESVMDTGDVSVYSIGRNNLRKEVLTKIGGE